MTLNGCSGRVDHPIGIPGIRNIPADHKTTKNINNGEQVHKAFKHSNIGYVNLPDLIAGRAGQIPE
jgi:hypothetical protein